MTRQCLDRRINDIEELRRELARWESERTEKCRIVDWQFTAEDARIKLKSLCPKIDSKTGNKCLANQSTLLLIFSVFIP